MLTTEAVYQTFSWGEVHISECLKLQDSQLPCHTLGPNCYTALMYSFTFSHSDYVPIMAFICNTNIRF